MAEVSMDLAELDGMRTEIKELNEEVKHWMSEEYNRTQALKRIQSECAEKQMMVLRKTILAKKNITVTDRILKEAIYAAVRNPETEMYMRDVPGSYSMRGGSSFHEREYGPRREMSVDFSQHSYNDLLRVLDEWAEGEIASGKHNTLYENVISESKEYVNLDDVKEEMKHELDADLVLQFQKLDEAYKKALSKTDQNNISHDKVILELNDRHTKNMDKALLSYDNLHKIASDEYKEKVKELEETINKMNKKETWREKLAAKLLGQP